MTRAAAGIGQVDLHVQALGPEREAAAHVVVLHGLFGSGTNWRAVATRLAERHRVLLVDLRNHGRSPHARPMDYDTMADDVVRVLDRMGLERAVVIGHSMGGKTAMRLASIHPTRVSRLCVVDIAPVAYEHADEHGQIVGWLESLPLQSLGGRAEADRALAAHVRDPALRGFLLQNLVSGPGGYAWRIALDIIRESLPRLLDFPDHDEPPYPGPTLFVRGEASHYIRSDARALLGARFTRARIATVKGAGHWVHAENPDAFLGVLVPFLAPGGAR